MLALGLMLVLLDPPDWSACEAVPWGAALDDGLEWTRDAVVPGDGQRPIYVRLCGMAMGFGYTKVLLAVWNERPGAHPATIRSEQGVTACTETTLKPEPKGLRVRTAACGYHDDGATAQLETRLRWLDEAPFVTVVE